MRDHAVVDRMNCDACDFRKLDQALRQHAEADAVAGNQWFDGQRRNLCAQCVTVAIDAALVECGRLTVPRPRDQRRRRQRRSQRQPGNQCRNSDAPRNRRPASPCRREEPFDVHVIRS
jgi:hypothetical protein